MNITGNNQKNTLVGTADDDVIRGLGGNDILKGLAGNDTLEGGNGKDRLLGGAGDNFFDGGAGNDTCVLGGRYETVVTGLGQDLIDLTSYARGEGWMSVQMHAGAEGLLAIVDGEEDYGMIRIDNGSGLYGLVEFKKLNTAMQLDYSKPDGGMEVAGTAFDDVFMIDPGAQGWIAIRPGEGEDLIQIEGTEGTVRLDYSDLSAGIVANLKFGSVIETGGGFSVDRIIGDGRVKELRATDHDDVVYGSKEDDRFILRQGNDFAAGGQGNDTIRYDRTGVEAVTVDLAKGTASGIWSGEAFTHTLRSFENICGSRDDNDMLFGNIRDNYITGKGGNDIIKGKAGNDKLSGDDGNDTLFAGAGEDNLSGGAGNDRFVFKSNEGTNYINDFEATNNQEKIYLKAVSEITSFADLMANHVTEVPVTINNDPNPTMSASIDDGAGTTILLVGVAMADLGAADFLF